MAENNMSDIRSRSRSCSRHGNPSSAAGREHMAENNMHDIRSRSRSRHRNPRSAAGRGHNW